MIKVRSRASLRLAEVDPSGMTKLEVLRSKINSDDYLHEAIHRIALIISNELLDLPQGGKSYERQRKSRQWAR